MPAGLIAGGLQTAFGIGQTILSAAKAKRAQRDLEQVQTPTTGSNAAVNSFYDRASANPYDTALYQNQKQNIERGVSTGVGLLQDRRGAIGGIAGLLRGQNDGLLKAAAAAQGQQNQMIGNATRMKYADDNRVFDINKMLPYQKKFSLLGAKAAAANQGVNAGIHNMFGGVQTAAMGGMGAGGFGGGGMGGGFGSLFGPKGASYGAAGDDSYS